MSGENLVTKKNIDIVKSFKRKLQGGDLFNREFLSETAHAGVNRLKEMFSKPQESWFLFICRGCRGQCSYCAIRRSVGPVKSKPISVVVAEFRRGLRAGYRDFSILGDDPGCYGLDNHERLPDLLQALNASIHETPVAGESPADLHFHIKEIHPKFFIKYEGQLLGQPFLRLVKSLLCPVQSGSDRILDLMRREHTSAELKQVLLNAREKLPQMDLDTQMIVGFPSETDNDFAATLDMVRQAQFNSVVVFPYHDKEGTPASEIKDKVSPEVIRKRMQHAFSYFRKHGVKAYYSCP
jgi:tRNA A37 methylthiotransferase MiaB